jgi:hypothetical protein
MAISGEGGNDPESQHINLMKGLDKLAASQKDVASGISSLRGAVVEILKRTDSTVNQLRDSMNRQTQALSDYFMATPSRKLMESATPQSDAVKRLSGKNEKSDAVVKEVVKEVETLAKTTAQLSTLIDKAKTTDGKQLSDQMLTALQSSDIFDSAFEKLLDGINNKKDVIDNKKIINAISVESKKNGTKMSQMINNIINEKSDAASPEDEEAVNKIISILERIEAKNSGDGQKSTDGVPDKSSYVDDKLVEKLTSAIYNPEAFDSSFEKLADKLSREREEESKNVDPPEIRIEPDEDDREKKIKNKSKNVDPSSEDTVKKILGVLNKIESKDDENKIKTTDELRHKPGIEDVLKKMFGGLNKPMPEFLTSVGKAAKSLGVLAGIAIASRELIININRINKYTKSMADEREEGRRSRLKDIFKAKETSIDRLSGGNEEKEKNIRNVVDITRGAYADPVQAAASMAANPALKESTIPLDAIKAIAIDRVSNVVSMIVSKVDNKSGKEFVGRFSGEDTAVDAIQKWGQMIVKLATTDIMACSDIGSVQETMMRWVQKAILEGSGTLRAVTMQTSHLTNEEVERKLSETIKEAEAFSIHDPSTKDYVAKSGEALKRSVTGFKPGGPTSNYFKDIFGGTGHFGAYVDEEEGYRSSYKVSKAIRERNTSLDKGVEIYGKRPAKTFFQRFIKGDSGYGRLDVEEIPSWKPETIAPIQKEKATETYEVVTPKSMKKERPSEATADGMETTAESDVDILSGMYNDSNGNMDEFIGKIAAANESSNERFSAAIAEFIRMQREQNGMQNNQIGQLAKLVSDYITSNKSSLDGSGNGGTTNNVTNNNILNSYETGKIPAQPRR